MVIDGFNVLGFFNSPILSIHVETIESEVDVYGIFPVHI